MTLRLFALITLAMFGQTHSSGEMTIYLQDQADDQGPVAMEIPADATVDGLLAAYLAQTGRAGRFSLELQGAPLKSGALADAGLSSEVTVQVKAYDVFAENPGTVLLKTFILFGSCPSCFFIDKFSPLLTVQDSNYWLKEE